jgi:hypothetical protein
LSALSVKGHNVSKVDRQKFSVLCVRDEQISLALVEDEIRVCRGIHIFSRVHGWPGNTTTFSEEQGFTKYPGVGVSL